MNKIKDLQQIESEIRHKTLLTSLSKKVCYKMNINPEFQNCVGIIGNNDVSNNLYAVRSWLSTFISKVPNNYSSNYIENICHKLKRHLADIRND